MELLKATLTLQNERGRVAVQMDCTFDSGEHVQLTVQVPRGNPSIVELQRAALARARTLLDEADRAWSTAQ